MIASQYWLAQWLDENEIQSEWEIDHALNSQATVSSLVDSVYLASQQLEAGEVEYRDPAEMNDSILAGTRLDFSARMACPSYECMRSRVDSTFKRVWHYFDQIAIQGLSPQALAARFTNDKQVAFGDLITMIRDQMRLLLYLRSIGAEPFVAFVPTLYSSTPPDQWQQRARELGLAAITDASLPKKAARKFIASWSIEIEEAGPDVWRVRVPAGKISETSTSLFLRQKKVPGPEEAVHCVVAYLAREMINDVTIARRFRLPLAESVSLPPMLRSYRDESKPKTEEDVVVRIGLPVFDGLATEDFLKLREDERPAFETFRAELRTAIQSEIARDPSRPAAVISNSIKNNYLRPGLALIDQRMRTRRGALAKKAALNLTIGTSVAAIGAIAGMPLLIESAAALGSSIPLAPIIHKYIDDGESIKMDKFYFLWQADKKSENH